MAQWLRWVADSQATWIPPDLDSNPARCWNSLLPLGHFAWHWARQCTDTLALFAKLSIICFFLDFVRGYFCTDRAVNFNTTILLPLFWRTWAGALASSRAQVLAWNVGKDHGYCTASELTDCQISGFSFFLMSRKYSKNEGLVRDFAPDCCVGALQDPVNIPFTARLFWSTTMTQILSQCQPGCATVALTLVLQPRALSLHCHSNITAPPSELAVLFYLILRRHPSFLATVAGRHFRSAALHRIQFRIWG